MRLGTVKLSGNREEPVVFIEGGCLPIRELLPDPPASLAELLAGNPRLTTTLRTLGNGSGQIETPVSFLAPVPQPRTFRDFYAFEQHVKAARAQRGLEMMPAWYEQPVFYFSNPGTLVGHNQPVYAPLGCRELDYELELGVVIGRGGRDIPAKEAWDHVAGFTIINDFSARDIQRREMAVGLGPAKGKDFATGVGPFIVTTDELRDRINADGKVQLEMVARVNGRELSHGNAASMYFRWPQLIELASRDAELFPGDLIGSGTVGTGCILELGPENTGGWLKPGDVVELEIERLGVLRNTVCDRAAEKSR